MRAVRVVCTVVVVAVLMASSGGAFALDAASTGAVFVSGRLAGGNGHTCVVIRAGLVKCFGLGTDGELGDGSATSSAEPVTVHGLSRMRAVTAGAYHSCAVSDAGAVSCWGYDAHGELGTRSTTTTCVRRTGEPGQACSTVPLEVRGLHHVLAIAAGAYHTCALRADRTVACWGYGAQGQLGNGTTRSSTAPVVVTGLSGARAITAGGTTSCALVNNGNVRCWGSSFGKRPTTVAGLGKVTSIAAGYYHVCAALASGAVKCWGQNSFGQLGDGTFKPASGPQTVLDVRNAHAVTAGEDDACALLSDHTVRCWGYDQWGQIGVRPNVTPSTSCDGGAPCHPIPVFVANLPRVSEIAAGFKHTCAATSTGSVECFGYGGDGELGPHSHNGSSFTPVPVSAVRV